MVTRAPHDISIREATRHDESSKHAERASLTECRDSLQGFEQRTRCATAVHCASRCIALCCAPVSEGLALTQYAYLDIVMHCDDEAADVHASCATRSWQGNRQERRLNNQRLIIYIARLAISTDNSLPSLCVSSVQAPRSSDLRHFQATA
jgi:hypothetical protein